MTNRPTDLPQSRFGYLNLSKSSSIEQSPQHGTAFLSSHHLPDLNSQQHPSSSLFHSNDIFLGNQPEPSSASVRVLPPIYPQQQHSHLPSSQGYHESTHHLPPAPAQTTAGAGGYPSRLLEGPLAVYRTTTTTHDVQSQNHSFLPNETPLLPPRQQLKKTISLSLSSLFLRLRRLSKDTTENGVRRLFAPEIIPRKVLFYEDKEGGREKGDSLFLCAFVGFFSEKEIEEGVRILRERRERQQWSYADPIDIDLCKTWTENELYASVPIIDKREKIPKSIVEVIARLTVQVSNLPPLTTLEDILYFFSGIEIQTSNIVFDTATHLKCFVQFNTETDKKRALGRSNLTHLKIEKDRELGRAADIGYSKSASYSSSWVIPEVKECSAEELTKIWKEKKTPSLSSEVMKFLTEAGVSSLYPSPKRNDRLLEGDSSRRREDTDIQRREERGREERVRGKKIAKEDVFSMALEIKKQHRKEIETLRKKIEEDMRVSGLEELGRSIILIANLPPVLSKIDIYRFFEEIPLQSDHVQWDPTPMSRKCLIHLKSEKEASYAISRSNRLIGEYAVSVDSVSYRQVLDMLKKSFEERDYFPVSARTFLNRLEEKIQEALDLYQVPQSPPSLPSSSQSMPAPLLSQKPISSRDFSPPPRLATRRMSDDRSRTEDRSEKRTIILERSPSPPPLRTTPTRLPRRSPPRLLRLGGPPTLISPAKRPSRPLSPRRLSPPPSSRSLSLSSPRKERRRDRSRRPSPPPRRSHHRSPSPPPRRRTRSSSHDYRDLPTSRENSPLLRRKRKRDEKAEQEERMQREIESLKRERKKRLATKEREGRGKREDEIETGRGKGRERENDDLMIQISTDSSDHSLRKVELK